MVEATKQEGDGIERPFIYANFRTDKPAAPGHTAELFSAFLDPKYYDDLAAQPAPRKEEETPY